MASAINVVLNAVDNFSSTLTGLNQGLELITKGLNAVKFAAEVTWSAVTKGVELAADGGNYNEIRRQYNNVADSFSRDGEAILKTLDSITNRTLDLPTAAGLAGKGIAAGLSEGQIESAFTFIKRRTELTGESFEGMADTVFKALQSGKTSVLGSMGVAVAKGDDLETVMRKITEATESYGDAGYNLADDLGLISQAQERFALAIGSSLSEVGFIQDAIKALSGIVSDFIDWFDPRPLTVFFDVFGNMAIDAVAGFAKAIPGVAEVFDYIKKLVGSTGDNFGDFVLGVSESLFSIVRTVATVTNQILDILDQMGIITFVEFVVSTVVETLRVGGGFITEAIGAIVFTTVTGFSEIIGLIADWARANPLLADSFGLDPMALTEMEMGFKKAANGIGDMTESFQKGIEKAADFGQTINAELSQALKTQRFDVGAIDQYENDMKSRISKIDFSKAWGEALSTGQKAQTELNQQTAYTAKMAADLAKDTEKTMKDAEKAQKDLIKQQQANEKERLDLEKQVIKDRHATFKEQADAEKEALKERQEVYKAQVDAEKEALKDRQEAFREQISAEKEALKDRQDKFREQIDADKEALNERQEAFREQNDADKEALNERQEKFREQIDAEKEALKEEQELSKENFDAEYQINKEHLDLYRDQYDLAKQLLLDDKDKKDALNKQQQDAIRDSADADKELRSTLEKNARDKAETDVNAIAEQISKLQIQLTDVGSDETLTKDQQKEQETKIKGEIDLLKQAEKERNAALKKELESIKENSEAEQKKAKDQIDAIKKQADAEAVAQKDKLKKLDAENKAKEDAIEKDNKRLKALQKQEEDNFKALNKEIEVRQKVEEDAQKAIAKEIKAKQKKEEDAQKAIAKEIEAKQKKEEDAQKAIADNIEAKQKLEEKGFKDASERLTDQEKAKKDSHDKDLKRIADKQKVEEKNTNSLIKGLDQAIKNIGKNGAKDTAAATAKDIAKELAKENAKNPAAPSLDKTIEKLGETIKDSVVDIKDTDKKQQEGSGLDETTIMMALAKWLKKQLASDAMGEGMPIVAVG